MSSILDTIVSRIRNDKRALGSVVLGSSIIGYLAISWLVSPKEGHRYMSPEQLELENEQTVVVASGHKVTVRRVLPAEARQAAKVLSCALAENPLMIACGAEVHDANTRKSALERLYFSTLRSCLPASSGAVSLRTDAGDAIAVWLPNGVELDLKVLAWDGVLPAMIHFGGWARLGRLWLYGQAVVPRRQRLTKNRNGKFYYLLLSGSASVSSSNSGAGAMPSSSPAGTSLEAVMLPVLKQADVRGVACFAEAVDAADRSLFTRLGFTAVDNFTLFGLPISIMLREAGKHSA